MRCAQAFSSQLSAFQLLNQRREHTFDFRGLLGQFVAVGGYTCKRRRLVG
jgi:hypothetical protein